MPFPFSLPTTSSFAFSSSFECPSHPSLPLAASTHRAVVRDTLKKHKRLPTQAQAVGLSTIQHTINNYLPLLFTLDCGISSQSVEGEEVDVLLIHSPNLEWRPVLTPSTTPGREPQRLKLHSLEYEIAFVLASLAHTQTLLARAALQPIYSVANASPSSEVRIAAVQNATKHLLSAASIHAYASSRLSSISTTGLTPTSADLSPAAHTALSHLAHAEASLLVVLRDDPYPAAVAQEANQNDKDWMISAPAIPKVRAHLFARLCLTVSEHARKAVALLRSSGKIHEALDTYCEDLALVGQAKACRFFGIDAEIGGEQGKGIAWLQAGLSTLKIRTPAAPASSKSKFSLSGLKNNIKESQENRRVEKSADWGADAGRGEEGRVVLYLLKKWSKMNDTINTQHIPSEAPLLAGMPSGREIHVMKTWTPPLLDSKALSELRAPPAREDNRGDADSSDEERATDGDTVVGAFPGTKAHYAGNGSYY